jgi:hypothetical protein
VSERTWGFNSPHPHESPGPLVRRKREPGGLVISAPGAEPPEAPRCDGCAECIGTASTRGRAPQAPQCDGCAECIGTASTCGTASTRGRAPASPTLRRPHGVLKHRFQPGAESQWHGEVGECAPITLSSHWVEIRRDWPRGKSPTIKHSVTGSSSRRCKGGLRCRRSRPHRRMPPVANRCRRRRRFAVLTPLCPAGHASTDPTEAPRSLKLGPPTRGRARFPGTWGDQGRQGRQEPGHRRSTQDHMPYSIRSVPRGVRRRT